MTSPSSNDRSTPSLWYENVTSPLKASKKIFRGMLAELHDKTSSTFGTFGGFTPRTARAVRQSDADDLFLYEHVYGGSLSQYPGRHTSAGDSVASISGLQLSPQDDIENKIFIDTEEAVFCNRNAITERRSDRIARDNAFEPVQSIQKSQSTGNIAGYNQKIKFNNFVLEIDSRL